MRIACPYCGERSLDEFLYSGDATVKRPDFASPTAANEFVSYTYERSNPPGMHRELWYHSAGCHAWLVVTRGIATHAITSVEVARDVALNEKPATKDSI
ncbi:sarcosine oxidase subunit delta [Hyphomicrobium sp. LHD-15]|uniref:sarcosine oxidase subunit delta n=1 Tax=Hyphomicrobium sp. LHD-15 TaxID=3072142 RepID=UPI00281078C5|nr:sarcosine oxidase subunit delta [Hyphomicrobium sp. LHD-15]MDQ8700705.1 sarcosine oxidase subunit delta [Hyphomicrobium sp. LHD-15]